MDDMTCSDVLLTVLVGLVIGITAYLGPTIMEIKRNIRDLWRWHSPNDDGVQTWKVPDLAPLIARLDTLIALMERAEREK